MFTFTQTLLAVLVAFVIGVMFHAAVTGWFDRIKGMADKKLHDKIDEIRAKL